MIKKTIILALFMAMLISVGLAKNVDLVTLPARESVQLTIYNSADITLAKETRYVTLKQGMNKLQFSWANTLIDPTSVEFRPLEHKNEIEVRDTVFPGQKPQHLYWNIDSKFEGQVKVEVSYFTSGLTWKMDYTAITDPAEEKMKFRGYVRVFNNSGEEYENAEIRLIVGKINLVEKIADLARRRGIAPPAPDSSQYKGYRNDAAKESFGRAEGRMPSASKSAGYKKPIVKEGISEYFMFSVPGEETIGNGWSKRMEAVKADDVKFDILYRMRAHQYGPRPMRFFIWNNDEKHNLGESPLPDGLVRTFRENGKDGLSYLGEQLIRYVPIKADIEVNLGTDDLVVYETWKASTKRYNFVYNSHNQVHGWDEDGEWIDTIRNYRTKPIKLELRRVWGGDIEYSTKLDTKLFDYRTTETTFTIAARDKTEYRKTVTQHYGKNAKQSRVKLKKR